MAKFGKGVKKDIAKQARALVKSQTAIGQPRHGDTSGKIHSIRTAQERSRGLVRAATYIKEEFGITRLKDITADMAKSYLDMRADVVGQKSLDNERLALQMLSRPGFAMEDTRLDRVKAEQEHSHYAIEGRAYTREQVDMIAQAQKENNELATRIAYAAGLRQHELFTLQPVQDRSATADRTWSHDRFTGREGVIYTVQGKGGLVREVIIPKELAARLEQQRLPHPEIKRDQGVSYEQRYRIGAGRAWASSFREAANRSIGWHKGPHGVRHSYAQERMHELQNQGMSYAKALGIVSQEMGHFRPDITEVYLR